MTATDLKFSNTNFTLAELLDTDFVRCVGCKAIFKNPLLLPCLHTFCEDCIVGIIARENVDRLQGEEQHIYEHNHERDNGDCQDQNSDISKTHVSSSTQRSTIHCKDQFKFNCPTCKSQITVDTKGRLKTNTTIDQDDDEIDDKKSHDKNTTFGESDQESDGDGKPPKASEQSLDIAPAAYKRLKRAIRCSLSSNQFVKSMTRLYRYRNDTERECAYCKTEDIVEAATCLCLQCGDDVCDGCANAHRKTRITRDHSVVPYTAIQQGLFDHDIRKADGITCEDHPESDVTHFCYDCLKVVCTHCRSTHHSSHSIHHLTKAVKKLAPDIQNIQDGLSRQIPDMSKYIDYLFQQLESLQQRHNRATQEINNQVKLVHRMVDEWRENIISKLDAAVTQEHETIQDTIDNIRVSKMSTEKSATFLLHLCHLGKADEMMGSYASIMRRYQQLIRTRPKGMTSRLGISFTPGPSTSQNIQILIGQLGLKQVAPNAQDATENRLPISSLMPATLESPLLVNSWKIATNSDMDQKSPQKPSSCYISGIDIKGNLLAAVDRNNAKVIIVDYTSQKVLKEFTGTGSHTLKKPFDIAFLPSGAIAVTDPEASAVRAFDWTGKYLFTFDCDIQKDTRLVGKGRKKREQVEEGDGEQALNVRHPRGITVTKKGEVVVLDGHLRHCTVHDSNTGKILRTIYPHREPSRKSNSDYGTSGKDPDHHTCKDGDSVPTSTKSVTEQLDVILVDPFYICTTQDDNLVITDAASPNVKILGWPSGELLQESLDYGIRQEECLHPTGVCVDHKSGYILLVDTNNNRIHLGLPDGHFSTILIPSSSSNPTPKSVTTTSTVDGDTNTDTTNNDNKVSEKQLSHPTCLCLDQDGQAIVAQIEGEINVYKYL